MRQADNWRKTAGGSNVTRRGGPVRAGTTIWKTALVSSHPRPPSALARGLYREPLNHLLHRVTLAQVSGADQRRTDRMDTLALDHARFVLVVMADLHGAAL